MGNCLNSLSKYYNLIAIANLKTHHNLITCHLCIPSMSTT